MGALEIIKKTDSNTGHWSGFVKHLDRTVYKSDLPFYPGYVTDDSSEEEAPKPSPVKKPALTSEPNTSLGKMLGGLKVDEN